MNDRSKSVTTPFQTVKFLSLVGLTLFMLIYNHYSDPLSSSLLIVRKAHFLPYTGILGAISVGFTHTITPKHLIIRLLGIPVRFVPWKDVTSAIYIHSWNFDKNRKEKGNYIVISFVGCPRFDPLHCKMMNYRLENPFGFSLLRFSDKEKDLIISAVQENFPEMTFQR